MFVYMIYWLETEIMKIWYTNLKVYKIVWADFKISLNSFHNEVESKLFQNEFAGKLFQSEFESC